MQFTQEEMNRVDHLGIEALVLFGSRAQGLSRTTSDFDFGVLLTRNLSVQLRSEIYDTLYDLLSLKIQQLVNIDIVFLHDASMELQSQAAAYGLPLYQRDANSFARFREKVMEQYADFAPLRGVFHQAILARIP